MLGWLGGKRPSGDRRPYADQITGISAQPKLTDNFFGPIIKHPLYTSSS
jgi:hypothetical protein